MKRPLAISVLGWLGLATGGPGVVFAMIAAVQQGGHSEIYRSMYDLPVGALALPLVIGFLLLRFPRGGVLTIHAFFASMVLAHLITWIHMTVFFRGPIDGLLVGLWQLLLAWAVAAALTLPFWRQTPWTTKDAAP